MFKGRLTITLLSLSYRQNWKGLLPRISARLLWQPSLLGFPLLAISMLAQGAMDVAVEGVSSEVKDNIVLHLSTWDTLPGTEIDDIRETVDPAVRRALRAMGYYQSTVQYQLDGKILKLAIDPGEPVIWNDVNIQLNFEDDGNDEVLQNNAKNHPFEKGRALNHKVYEDFKLRVLTAMAERGYLDAQLSSSELRIDPVNHNADVSIVVAAGKRYRISSIAYGESKVKEELLEVIAKLPEEGDWYSANLIGDVYNRLIDSGYFSAVTISVDKQPPNLAQIKVNLTDQSAHLVSAGIGVGTDVKGLRYRLKWQMPIINPRGDSLLTELKVTKIDQELFSEYRIPWDHPLDQYININAGWQHKDNEDLETHVVKTGISYNRVLPKGWQYSYHLDLEMERSQLGENEDETYTYVIPNVQLSRRKFKGDPADPTSGYKYWVHAGISLKEIGSSEDFDQANIGLNTVYTFFDHHSVVTRVEFGVIKTDNVLLIPASQRYFAGGDQSVRGYSYESISPVDLDGNLSGGQYLNSGSVEYRYEFRPNWKLALFADSGRVYRDMPSPQPIDPVEVQQWKDIVNESEKFKTGVGVGLRWKTPIGLLALDFASPLDDDDEKYRIHFFLGTSL